MIKSMRTGWAGHAARIREKRNAYRVLVGKPEGKRPLGKPGHRWENHTKMRSYKYRIVWYGLD
jgi:hypothetical protein